MHRQRAEQLGKGLLSADDAHRILQRHGGLEQPVRDRLGDRVEQAHPEGERTLRRACAQHLREFIAERKDLLGVTQGETSRLRGLHTAARPHQQGRTQRILELAQLRADGLRSEVQLGGGSPHATLLHDGREVLQVAVIETGH